MRKESYQIKRPEHLVIGDPWYFETVDSQKLKSLVIDVLPQKEFVAALTIEETEYDECMTNIIFALEEELDTYLKGYMYAGQKEQVKKLPVDTAEYLIQVDGRAANIHTHEDGYWGQQLTLYSEEKGQKHPDAYIITISTPDDMSFEEVKGTMGTLFESMKLIPQKEKTEEKSMSEPKR